MANQPQQQQEGITPKDSLNLLLAIAHTHAACLTPFLRHTFGRDQPGLFGAAGLVVMLLYGEQMHDRAMLLYVAAWLAALAYHAVSRLWLPQQHSFYSGFPYLALGIPFVRRESTARLLEPVLCFLAGQLLLPFSVPLGQFVQAGAASLLIVELAGRRLTSRRLIAMHNAEIEMRHLTDAYRRGL